MNLSGIEIFKMLPKTNCRECGVPTCMAFAMNLAAGKAELDSCPDVSDEAREKLAEASTPPVRPVSLGAGVRKAVTGGETVLCRHEKTFYNPTLLAAEISSALSVDEAKAKLANWNAFQYERVGLNLRPELVAVRDAGKGADAFAAIAEIVAKESEFNLILVSDDVEAMKAAVEKTAFKRPLVYAATEENCDAMAALAKENSAPLAVRAESIDTLTPLTDKLAADGFKDLVIDVASREIKDSFAEQVQIRTAAIKAVNRSVGYPTITFTSEMADNIDVESMLAATYIAKYAGIVVMSDFVPENLFPLLLGRLNLFTDPQKPMCVTEGIYPLNNPDENSPVMVTTNFALTYFIVSGEIESCKEPCWLLIKDAEGLSVLTAWAAGKFSGDDVGMFIKKCGIEEKINHKKVIIPGYTASIAGEVEEELGPEWTVTVGTREAAHLAAHLKKYMELEMKQA